MRDAASALRGRAGPSGIGLLALIGAGAAMAAASQTPSTDTYTWHAELVAFDQAANTITVKSRVVEPKAEKLDALQPGADAVLTWSGLSTAAGVRAIERGERSSYDRMTLPIEFVSSDSEGRYVTFKVKIPAEDAAAIAALMPGEWITATSPQKAADAEEAVESIRPYVLG